MEALTHTAAPRRSRLATFWSSLDRSQRKTLLMMVAVVVGLHVAGFLMLIALVVPHHFRLGSTGAFTVGIGVTAYTLGMRHAFDADHISAIDNTTRKLMTEGKRPLSVGFWFSLGHSTVVFVLALLLSVGIKAIDGPIKHDQSNLHRVTNWIGALVFWQLPLPDRGAQHRRALRDHQGVSRVEEQIATTKPHSSGNCRTAD